VACGGGRDGGAGAPGEGPGNGRRPGRVPAGRPLTPEEPHPCDTDVVRPGPEASSATDAGLPGGTGGAAEVNEATRHNEESGLWRTGYVRT